MYRLLGGSLRLAAPTPAVAKVLRLTGVHRHLDTFRTTFRTLEAAITGQPKAPA